VHLPARPAFAVIDLLTDLGLAIAGLGLTTVSASHTHPCSVLPNRPPESGCFGREGQAFEEVNLFGACGPT